MKYDAIGPIAKKGKKANTTSMIMLATKTIVNIKVSVFKPEVVPPRFRPIIEPESANSIAKGAKRPINITIAVAILKNGVFAWAPKKSDPLFAAALVNS